MDAELPAPTSTPANADATSSSVSAQPSPSDAAVQSGMAPLAERLAPPAADRSQPGAPQDDAVGPAIPAEALDAPAAVEALAAAVAADLPAGTQAVSTADPDLATLRACFDNAPLPIAIARSAGRSFDYANPAFTALTQDRDLTSLGVFDAADGVRRSGETACETIALGERHYKLVYTPSTAGGSVDGVMMFAFDVTEQVLRDAFFAAASHEIRDPIHVLQLQFSAILSRVERDSHNASIKWIHARLSRANGQLSRLMRLVDTVLDVSRVASGRLPLMLENVDLAEVVGEVVDRLEPEQRTQISTRLDATTGMWDRVRLDQVVTNLVSNAVKYGEGRPIEIVVTTHDGRARLEVTDHGIGIAPHHQARVFERFERAVSDRRYDGFGLGLWITSRIVSESGGTMSLRSEPGVGSTFTVDLPPRAADRRLKERAKRARG